MIAVDTSTFSDYLKGKGGRDIELLDVLLVQHSVIMIPVVLSELLTSRFITDDLSSFLILIPTLDIKDGYWIRTGELRKKIFKDKLKANLADSLIAQFCIDYDLQLLTRDTDFRNFEKHGLKLI